MGKKLKLIDTVDNVRDDALAGRVIDIHRVGYYVKVEPYHVQPELGPFSNEIEPYVRYKIKIYKEVIK